MPGSSRTTATLVYVDDDEWDVYAQMRRCLYADFIDACAGAFDAACGAGSPDPVPLGVATPRIKPAALIDELAAVAGRVADVWRAACAEARRFRAEVSTGQLDAAAATVERHRQLTQRSQFRMFGLMTAGYETVLGFAAGRFAAADAAARRAHALGGDDAAFYNDVYGLQMLTIRRAEGRVEETLPLLRTFAHRRGEPVWRAGLSALCADAGLIDEARRELEAVVGDDLGDLDVLTRDSMWPATLAYLAEGALAVGDLRLAEAIARELAAFRGQNLVPGAAAMLVCLGPADRLLGGLAALAGRPDEAEAHFQVAYHLARSSDSPVWRVLVEHDWAQFLESQHESQRAFELGSAAARDAEALGMMTIARRAVPGATAIGASGSTRLRAAGRVDGLSAREVDVLQLVASGCSNREIGKRLYISANTAANHVRSILQKTGCANRAQAVAFAARRHLLEEMD